jgi:hypothetical protein
MALSLDKDAPYLENIVLRDRFNMLGKPLFFG